MNCDKTSNNKYFNCPAITDSGRGFTDYRRNCVINNTIKRGNNLENMNDNEYRLFLTRNAVSIMKKNDELTFKLNGCECDDQVPGTGAVRSARHGGRSCWWAYPVSEL